MPDPETGKFPLHYGWVIVCTGTLCLFGCLGLGRFAFGMLLPSMASTLHLTYSQMGFLSTANFLGYLVSVLASGFWAARVGPRRMIFSSLLAVGITMAGISQAGSFTVMLFFYMLTGMASGATNIPVMGLVSAWFSSSKRGKAAGFIVIGSGFAIMLSGKLIPFVNRLAGPEGWRTSWLILSAVVMCIAFVSRALLRDRPEQKGLVPAGSPALDAMLGPPDEKEEGAGINIYRSWIIYYLGAIYFLFGYSYVIYTTFIVTAMVRERGFSESVAGNFWSWLGFLSLFSGPVFGTLSDRLGRKNGLMIVFFLQMISYLLVASGLPGIFLYLSIFFYGIVAWSIPSIIAAAMGDYAGAHKAAAAFGLVTFIFGLGQLSGPAVAGMMAERTGSFAGSFYMAAISAGLAILLTMFLKQPAKAL